MNGPLMVMFGTVDTAQYECSAAVNWKGASPLLSTLKVVSSESLPSSMVYRTSNAKSHMERVYALSLSVKTTEGSSGLHGQTQWHHRRIRVGCGNSLIEHPREWLAQWAGLFLGVAVRSRQTRTQQAHEPSWGAAKRRTLTPLPGPSVISATSHTQFRAKPCCCIAPGPN